MFSSFFGAFMMAAAYGYFHYTFSSFKFLDFKDVTLYSDKDIFKPKKDNYIILAYSSRKSNLKELEKKIDNEDVTILAIDFAQKNRLTEDKLLSVTGGFDQILTIIHKFRIEHIPSAFYIVRTKDTMYKQDSIVTEF
jgi:hypothetical protein